MDDSKFLITGANGQLGLALQAQYPNARATDSTDLDITDREAVNNFDLGNVTTILNAAGYTNVDNAETPEGKKLAWAVNDQGVGNLAEIARQKNLLLVHISTEYVFDGNKTGSYKEDEAVNPLGEYAKSKAAGDQKAAGVPKHYILRTSWIVGDGKNFVRTMLELGKKGVEPRVVNDQIGRPTFGAELARVIDFLIKKQAPYGIYNVSNEGQPVSWADLTRAIFKEAGYSLPVTDITTTEYFASKTDVAPRPHNSVLDLSKIESAGFRPPDWQDDLKDYVNKEIQK